MESVARLYDYFKPSHYEVSLQPDKESMTFSGSVIIRGTLVKSSTSIRLHTKGLSIRSAYINDAAVDVRLDEQNDELILQHPATPTGTCSVRISFDGAITKPMHGMYPCFVKNGDILLATQFESHHAREAFPCIDEPAAKATFDLILTHATDEAALSNMPAVRTLASEQQGKSVTTFATTPKMSTYLLAFVTGPMQHIEGKTKNDTLVRIWSSTDQPLAALDFALHTAVDCIEFFDDYFDTPYPLPKCDHVALPDFSSGAMENWGLLTFREACLLADPATTSSSSKESVAMVIAHEISHQWFGNLVTMAWWDDLWLNESFANMMEYVAIDHLYPEWQPMLTFAAQEALSAFSRDSNEGVQAVRTAVHHPDEISTLFDPSIVYAKGGRLLNMMRQYVGEDAFRAGLKAYFKKHAYGNTTGDDLWNAIGTAAKKDVSALMHTWLPTSNFPLVSVTQKGNALSLAQERFTSAGLQEPSRWIIPLTPSLPLKIDTLSEPMLRTEAPLEPVQINTGGGHYSVRYTEKAHRDALRAHIESGAMSAESRLLYLYDNILQSRAGLIHIEELLDLLGAFYDESSEPVWDVITLAISDAKRLVEELPELEPSLKSYVGSVVGPNYMTLGWDTGSEDDQNTLKLREIILSLAVYAEQPEVVAAALERYADPSSLEPNTRAIVLSSNVRHSDAFDELFALYPLINNPDLQQDIGSALCATQSPDQAKQILTKLKDADFVRPQDVGRFVAYLIRNPKTRPVTWRWLQTSWTWIEECFKSDKSYDYYPRYVASAFSTQSSLDEYRAFFEPLRSDVALERSIDLGINEITNRVSWRKREENHLRDWLARQSSSKK